MKILLFGFFIIIGINVSAQKYALIDQNAKLPIIYTDSVSAHQVAQGYFPVEKANIDTFLANLNYIQNLLKDDRKRAKFQSFELRNGATIITVMRVPYAYGDQYKVVSQTKAGDVVA